jgi:hypothetical protein
MHIVAFKLSDILKTIPAPLNPIDQNLNPESEEHEVTPDHSAGYRGKKVN